MNAIVATSSAALAPPPPREALTFRLGTMADLPFVDSLQKRHGKALGFMKGAQYEGHVNARAVLVAEGAGGRPVGYCISRDRYLKRDELGVIFQLCVEPGMERGYVGAALLREVFERSAYGCRLYCCWCAQDLVAANAFWEAMGFVPLAFRQGSEKKARVHIFWQKKIVATPLDAETKWWYPFQTTGGAIRADRLVFPIPDGTHWRDVRAVELPEVARASRPCLPTEEARRTGGTPVVRKTKPAGPQPMGGFRFQSEVVPAAADAKGAKLAKVAKPKAPKVKIDPRFLAAGRELRDRYLEHVNAGALLLESAGKYDVVRQRHLSATATEVRLLPAA